MFISKMVKCLFEAGERLPRSKFRPNVKPLWNSNLSKLKKEKAWCFCLWRDAGSPKDSNNELYIFHKRVKKLYKRTKKSAERSWQMGNL